MSRGNWWTALLGVGLALVGVWGAWVPHRAAALVLSSWDLAEFAKFVPGPTVTREFFYLPVWCAGIALAVLAIQPTAGLLLRLGLSLVALGLMLALLPPYPHVLNGYQSAEFRWRLVLGASGVLLVLGLLLASHLDRLDAYESNRVVGGLLLALGLVGAVPALWQFMTLRGAIEAVYGARLGWGWGLGVFLVGWALVGVAGARLQMQTRTHKGPREP
jgi:hypothetical protein